MVIFFSQREFLFESDVDTEKTQTEDLPETTLDQEIRVKIQKEFTAALIHEGVYAHANTLKI